MVQLKSSICAVCVFCLWKDARAVEYWSGSEIIRSNISSCPDDLTVCDLWMLLVLRLLEEEVESGVGSVAVPSLVYAIAFLTLNLPFRLLRTYVAIREVYRRLLF